MKPVLSFTLLLSTIFLLSSTELSAEEITYLTTQQFKEKIFDYTKHQQWDYQGELPCIIDFYTTWCGPCKRLSPILEELSEEYRGQIVIYKVDTEREREVAAAFGINSIPTLLFCPVNNTPQMAKGLLPKQILKQAIDEVLLTGKK